MGRLLSLNGNGNNNNNNKNKNKMNGADTAHHCNTEFNDNDDDRNNDVDDNNSCTATRVDETRAVYCLRLSVLTVLLMTAIVLSAGVYIYTRDQERNRFVTAFQDDALQVVRSFHSRVELNIGSIAALSTALTSESTRETSRGFPFVTLPDFELHGSQIRVLSGSHIIHWTPLVTQDKVDEWEAFAMEHRGHIDVAYAKDERYRAQQNEQLGVDGSNFRRLEDTTTANTTTTTTTADTSDATLELEESGFHEHIWGDTPEGTAPYLPTWQRSPVDGSKQKFLNYDFKRWLAPGVVETMIEQRKAILSDASYPIPSNKPRLEANLRLSQYREYIGDYIDGLSTFMVYPVFDSFDPEQQQVAGALLTNVYWKVLFSQLLSDRTRGIVCVVENSFNQSFSYRIDGTEATFLGVGDFHDSKYDSLGVFEDVNAYLRSRAEPRNQGYATVPLSDDTNYKLRIYPSQETEDLFVSSRPIVYTIVVICTFAFTSILFMLFSYVVERRHCKMMTKVIENAHKAATAERELNEFLSHEVRNPLAAAISACFFVTTAVNDAQAMQDAETRKNVQEDLEVVNSSLQFINDFLRSMLDIHRATGKRIKIETAPTDILKDIMDPVSAIIYKRMANFQIIIDCPENLIVVSDSLRLKQVILNLVRNASKFVEKGFLRMRATTVNGLVRICVEDSGPGIKKERQRDLFAKYQESLDLLSQGTGIGLNLSKRLMTNMGGDLWLDSSYDSGVEGCPGACFVVDLRIPPVDIEATLLETECETDPPNDQLSLEDGGPQTVQDGLPVFQKAPSSGVFKPQELPEELSLLFVDDDAVLRKLFVRAVKRAQPSWKVQEASSGEAALRMCEEETFDLIFLDQYMASVDKQLLGTETAQTMRSRGVHSRICGLSANDLRDSFINSGADAFLMKPIPCKTSELEATLIRILQTNLPVEQLWSQV